MAGRLFVRGDTHANFDFLPYFCEENQTDYNDILIILGDVGILYYNSSDNRERNLKKYIEKQPITIVCIRGNHEDRPSNRDNMYKCVINNEIMAGTFFYETDYPHILYTIDGNSYEFMGQKCLAVGGAYSVDKWYRLQMGWKWFIDEELTDDEMETILNSVKNSKYDHVFTHTCPEPWEPTDLFFSSIDQNTVSKRMEKFLYKLSNNIEWGHWWFGHFHADREDICGDGKVSMLFNKVVQLI